ncbi:MULTISPECIES: AAA family ATPase [unclassified Pseudomonas]|uniref:AAA family ATPase n=1 Tax=unclassified Pseudomonas TaxID=196821 RepID=UPI00200D97E8|nr:MULTISPECIES: AAA family ATPase [unclassified Pseudomonas]
MWTVNIHNESPDEIEPDIAAIFPTNKGWNDFGYNFRAHLKINSNGIYLEFPIMLLPFVEDKAQNHVSTWISNKIKISQKKEPPTPENKKFPNYITVFTSVESYQILAKKLTREHYEALLLSIGEINSFRVNNKIDQQTYKSIIEAPEFVAGITRNAGAYRALRFGYFSARRLAPPDEARIPFSYSTKLDGYASPHHINFSFSENNLMPDRIHCLIGVNGVGKTRYLNSLIHGILKKVNSLSDVRYRSDLFDSYGKPTDQLSNDLSLAQWETLPPFSTLNMYSTDPHNNLPRTSSITGVFNYNYFDMGLEGSSSLTTMLADMLRSDVPIGNEDRFILLKKIMQKIIPAGILMIPVLEKLENTAKFKDIDGNHWIPIGAIRGGELRKLEIIGNIDTNRDITFQIGASLTTPLSSGQKMYFRFATHFLTSATKGMIVLLDEPETHLHPNLITEFMNLLHTVLSATSSIAVIATHSAYVVREVPTHCVHVIKSDNEKIVSTQSVYLNTLGANISSLSDIVFGDSLAQSFSDKIAEELATSGASFEKIIENYKSILSMDMLMKIRELMKRENHE